MCDWLQRSAIFTVLSLSQSQIEHRTLTQTVLDLRLK